jgi:hypothetical protein
MNEQNNLQNARVNLFNESVVSTSIMRAHCNLACDIYLKTGALASIS